MEEPTLTCTDGNGWRQLRRALGLNQQQFWNRIGITQPGGCRYEKGRNMPKHVLYLVNIAYGPDMQAEGMVAWLRRLSRTM